MSTTITRHQIDLKFCKSVLGERRESAAAWVPAVGKNPNFLSILADDCLAVAGYSSVVEPKAMDFISSMQLASDALCAQFAVGAKCSAENPVSCRLQDEVIDYTSPVDESSLEPAKWMQAYFLSVILHNSTSLDVLCETSVDELRASSTKHPEYRYLFAEAMRHFWLEKDDTSALLLESMRATDPERADVPKSFALHIDVPLIHAFSHATSENPRFSATMIDALKKHKKFWSSGSRKNDCDGFMSLGLIATAALGIGRGLDLDVESEYIPSQLIGEGFPKGKRGRVQF